MRFQEFIDELYKAGWKSPCDAQHHNIEKLWRKLFPVIAQLEDELDKLSLITQSITTLQGTIQSNEHE